KIPIKSRTSTRLCNSCQRLNKRLRIGLSVGDKSAIAAKLQCKRTYTICYHTLNCAKQDAKRVKLEEYRKLTNLRFSFNLWELSILGTVPSTVFIALPSP